MNLSITHVCNLAIAVASGVPQADAALLDTYDGDPQDTSAHPLLGWFQQFFPIAANWTQQALNWPECLRYAEPGAVLETYDLMPGWEYIYAKPVPCLALRGVVNSTYIDLSRGIESRYPYMELGDQIGCNYSDIYIKYLIYVEDVTKWSMPLVYLTANWLAYLLARKLTNEQGQAQVWELYKRAYLEAKGMLAQRSYATRLKRPAYRELWRRTNLRYGITYDPTGKWIPPEY